MVIEIWSGSLSQGITRYFSWHTISPVLLFKSFPFCIICPDVTSQQPTRITFLLKQGSRGSPCAHILVCNASSHNVDKGLAWVREALWDTRHLCPFQTCLPILTPWPQINYNFFPNFVPKKFVTFTDCDHPPWMSNFGKNKINWKHQILGWCPAGLVLPLWEKVPL